MRSLIAPWFIPFDYCRRCIYFISFRCNRIMAWLDLNVHCDSSRDSPKELLLFQTLFIAMRNERIKNDARNRGPFIDVSLSLILIRKWCRLLKFYSEIDKISKKYDCDSQLTELKLLLKKLALIRMREKVSRKSF